MTEKRSLRAARSHTAVFVHVDVALLAESFHCNEYGREALEKTIADAVSVLKKDKK